MTSPGASIGPDAGQRIWVTVTKILQHAYCPRYTYFEQVLGISQRQGLRYKVRLGRKVHERRARTNRGYCRKRLGVARKLEDIAVYSDVLRINGRIDEVLFLQNGTVAGLDYKVSPKPRRPRNHIRAQAVLYAMLLEETYSLPAPVAYVVYLREPRGRHEIRTTPQLRHHVATLISKYREVVAKGALPRATPHRGRCPDCSFRNICPLPSART